MPTCGDTVCSYLFQVASKRPGRLPENYMFDLLGFLCSIVWLFLSLELFGVSWIFIFSGSPSDAEAQALGYNPARFAD